MARFKVPTAFLLLLGAAALTSVFTGCYTQLYSHGYAERAAANYPEYSRAPRTAADTLVPDSATLAIEDSLRRVDSLYASGGAGSGASGSGSVIVNNYYQESPYYRGYLIQDWNYPTLTFGIYSSRYRDYYGPYWWNDPWYRAGGGYHRRYHGHRGHHGNHGGYDPPAGGGTGPYTSDKRIFTPTPHRELDKGRRRADPAPAPAPKYGSDNGSSSGSGSSSSSSGSSSGSSSSTSSGSSSGSKSESGSSDKDDHPTLNKGKRR